MDKQLSGESVRLQLAETFVQTPNDLRKTRPDGAAQKQLPQREAEAHEGVVARNEVTVSKVLVGLLDELSREEEKRKRAIKDRLCRQRVQVTKPSIRDGVRTRAVGDLPEFNSLDGGIDGRALGPL